VGVLAEGAVVLAVPDREALHVARSEVPGVVGLADPWNWSATPMITASTFGSASIASSSVYVTRASWTAAILSTRSSAASQTAYSVALRAFRQASKWANREIGRNRALPPSRAVVPFSYRHLGTNIEAGRSLCQTRQMYIGVDTPRPRILAPGSTTDAKPRCSTAPHSLLKRLCSRGDRLDSPDEPNG
jgi:hypothetical protein